MQAAGSTIGNATTRLTELSLTVAGLWHFLASGDGSESEVVFLLAWNAVTIVYLVVGGWRVRRRAGRGPPQPGKAPGWSTKLRGQRASFLFTVAASVTGLTAALDVLSNKQFGELAPLTNGLGATTVICAWLLLHVGYARYYAAWNDDAQTQGIRFPGCDDPGFVEYLYFSVTIGVSFAASDVQIRNRALRWHVLVHSVVSFFYNALVLATAVRVVTGA